MESIPDAGAFLATTNVIERKGLVRWMVRMPPSAPADDGWQIMSHIDTSDCLNDTSNWQIVDFNDLRTIKPALIGIWGFPVGSGLQLVRNEHGIHAEVAPPPTHPRRRNRHQPQITPLQRSPRCPHQTLTSKTKTAPLYEGHSGAGTCAASCLVKAKLKASLNKPLRCHLLPPGIDFNIQVAPTATLKESIQQILPTYPELNRRMTDYLTNGASPRPTY